MTMRKSCATHDSGGEAAVKADRLAQLVEELAARAADLVEAARGLRAAAEELDRQARVTEAAVREALELASRAADVQAAAEEARCYLDEALETGDSYDRETWVVRALDVLLGALEGAAPGAR